MADVALPKTNQTGTNEWVDVQDNDDRLLAVINKDYDSPLAEVVGMSIDSGSTRRDTTADATEDVRTATSWGDCASTIGPSVTLTVPSNSLVLVGVSMLMHCAAGSTAYVGVYEGTDHPINVNPGTLPQQIGAVGQYEWLLSTAETSYASLPYRATTMIPATAGTRTYTLKYATSNAANAATFKNRNIWALALGGF